jgi:hypothetical protein
VNRPAVADLGDGNPRLGQLARVRLALFAQHVVFTVDDERRRHSPTECDSTPHAGAGTAVRIWSSSASVRFSTTLRTCALRPAVGVQRQHLGVRRTGIDVDADLGRARGGIVRGRQTEPVEGHLPPMV